VQTFYGQGGFFRCGLALFDTKNFGFFEIYGVFAQIKGFSEYEHFVDKRRDEFFAILCGSLL